jgi:hypothetical protein
MEAEDLYNEGDCVAQEGSLLWFNMERRGWFQGSGFKSWSSICRLQDADHGRCGASFNYKLPRPVCKRCGTQIIPAIFYGDWNIWLSWRMSYLWVTTHAIMSVGFKYYVYFHSSQQDSCLN